MNQLKTCTIMVINYGLITDSNFIEDLDYCGRIKS